MPNQIYNSPLATAKTGSTYTFTPEISNSDGSTLTYTVDNLPSWASFDTSTGVLTGTAATGTYPNVKITLSDGKSADTNSVSFNITVTPWSLTKTGQTTSYVNYDDGYDQYGTANSFTRDSAGVVTDNVNGLMWQNTSSIAVRTWTSAETYCNDLTLDGYSDWRLPSLTDLESIVDYSKQDPAVSNEFYNAGTLYYYWSSTPNNQLTDQAWAMSLFYGREYTAPKSNSQYVMCVRGNSAPSKSYSRDNTNETVTDNNLGLMWEDDSEASTQTMYWTSAINYCENKTPGGYSDWRLPNYRELATLVDRGQSNPAINNTFIYKASGYYWSSTLFPDITSSEFFVINFSDGTLLYNGNSFNYYVRCVSGRQH